MKQKVKRKITWKVARREIVRKLEKCEDHEEFDRVIMALTLAGAMCINKNGSISN